MNDTDFLKDRFAGILLGTAVGDSLGLPAEGMSRRRMKKIFKGEWRQRFILGRGMTSDDTEHAFFVAQALLNYPGDPKLFQESLAWKLRLWLLGLPAGVGFATLRACIKLWLGFPPGKSGVFSAGNGPAMRTAIIGAYFLDDVDEIKKYVRASTELTHEDPKAFTGALVVTLLASYSVRRGETEKPDLDEVIKIMELSVVQDDEWMGIVEKFREADESGLSVVEFALSIGAERGVSGYIYRTVPVAVYAWFRHYGDFRKTLESVLDCGGDTDTVGAITGALAGAVTGADGIPDEWLSRIWEWPRSKGVLRKAAEKLAEQKSAGRPLGQVGYFWPFLLPRNIFFLVIVLLHGFRRLFPPY
ncbi:MAG: hypothetical protein E3J72_04725 [Planctomycetota bacterium]|nr:MAG: hypothetical protein E3J72_04725 [Planctomycetota bacterium]